MAIDRYINYTNAPLFVEASKWKDRKIFDRKEGEICRRSYRSISLLLAQLLSSSCRHETCWKIEAAKESCKHDKSVNMCRLRTCNVAFALVTFEFPEVIERRNRTSHIVSGSCNYVYAFRKGEVKK